MTWQHTFPDPIIYYHAPHKTIARNPLPDRLLDGLRYALTLWTPQRRHEYNDPYHPAQRGHLARITLNHYRHDGTRTQYDLHQTKRGITATATNGKATCPMSSIEIATLASIAHHELWDYDQGTDTTWPRHRDHHRVPTTNAQPLRARTQQHPPGLRRTRKQGKSIRLTATLPSRAVARRP